MKIYNLVQTNEVTDDGLLTRVFRALSLNIGLTLYRFRTNHERIWYMRQLIATFADGQAPLTPAAS